MSGSSDTNKQHKRRGTNEEGRDVNREGRDITRCANGARGRNGTEMRTNVPTLVETEKEVRVIVET